MILAAWTNKLTHRKKEPPKMTPEIIALQQAINDAETNLARLGAELLTLVKPTEDEVEAVHDYLSDWKSSELREEVCTDAYIAMEVLQQRADTEADTEGTFEPNYCTMPAEKAV
jgi:hypothetical protein